MFRPAVTSATTRRPGWIAVVVGVISASTVYAQAQQAASWKVFKSPEPAGANVLYVFVIDPSVKDADYTVSNILAEAFTPAELNVIYKQYADSYAQGQNIINLNLITNFGK